jgi:hypothetical protein
MKKEEKVQKKLRKCSENSIQFNDMQRWSLFEKIENLFPEKYHFFFPKK